MRTNLKTPILAICAAVALAGCVTDENNTEQGMCNLESTERLIGLVNPSDEQIMEITGATAVRRANDGQPMTMELLPYRATVIMNAESGEITQANCS